jgi:hypothetical protein
MHIQADPDPQHDVPGRLFRNIVEHAGWHLSLRIHEINIPVQYLVRIAERIFLSGSFPDLD